MPNPAPIDPKVPATGSSAEPAAPVTPPPEETIRQFWEKNSRTIYAVCVVILLAIIGRGGWEYYEHERENSIESDFALASSPDKLRAFISQNPTHTLAGVASLSLADDAYSASNYSEALTNYQRAADILKTGPLAGRARLGVAVAKVALNQPDGEERLKQLANDATQLKPIRGEAAYHLAALAVDTGRTEDATKYIELTSTVDAGGTWADRAMMLRSSLPTPATQIPSVSIKPPTKP